MRDTRSCYSFARVRQISLFYNKFLCDLTVSIIVANSDLVRHCFPSFKNLICRKFGVIGKNYTFFALFGVFQFFNEFKNCFDKPKKNCFCTSFYHYWWVLQIIFLAKLSTWFVNFANLSCVSLLYLRLAGVMRWNCKHDFSDPLFAALFSLANEVFPYY